MDHTEVKYLLSISLLRCLPSQLTSMGTIVEGNLDEILALTKRMHETPFLKGIDRVVTTIRIDDRRDRKATSSGKIGSVTGKLRREVTDDFKRQSYHSSGT